MWRVSLRTGETGFVIRSVLFGPQELAALLVVNASTVHQWHTVRHLLPEPLLVRSGVPLWAWAEGEPIYNWARQTGRLKDEGSKA
jgi:hypothetical protein